MNDIINANKYLLIHIKEILKYIRIKDIKIIFQL